MKNEGKAISALMIALGVVEVLRRTCGARTAKSKEKTLDTKKKERIVPKHIFALLLSPLRCVQDSNQRPPA